MWGRGPSASARHKAGASEDNEGGRLGADAGAQKASGMGVGWGAARPGAAPAPRSPGPGLGSGAARGCLPSGAGSGMSGPWAGGRARPPPLTQRSGLSRGRRSSSGRDTGSGSCGRLRPPWPGPTARSAVPAAPGPPPAAAAAGHGAEPPREAGRGRADPRTGGPTDHCAAASLPRYGSSEGQARPARPRARPRLQRARTRRAPLHRPPLPLALRGPASGETLMRMPETQERRGNPSGSSTQLALGMERGQKTAG